MLSGLFELSERGGACIYDHDAEVYFYCSLENIIMQGKIKLPLVSLKLVSLK